MAASHAQRIFVIGFPEDFDERRLAAIFAPYGDVPYAEIVRKAGRSFAFVDLAPPSAAARAIDELHRSLLDGGRLTVERANRVGRGKRALYEVVAQLDDEEIETVHRFARDLLTRRPAAR